MLSCCGCAVRGPAVFSDPYGLGSPALCTNNIHMSTTRPQCDISHVCKFGLNICVSNLRVCRRSSRCEAVSVLRHPQKTLSPLRGLSCFVVSCSLPSRSQLPCLWCSRPTPPRLITNSIASHLFIHQSIDTQDGSTITIGLPQQEYL